MPVEDEASVEFHLPAQDALGRLDVDGKVRWEGGTLFVHWKRRDRTFTRTKNTLHTSELSPGDVDQIKLETGWFNTTLRLHVKDPRSLDGMPGVEMGKLVVKLQKDQRPAAQKLVSVVDFEMSQYRADKSQRRLNDLESKELGDVTREEQS